MKTDYDANLYRKIASLQLDELVQVVNKKRTKTAVHITNIAKLSWRELQLLMPEGVDRFSKMALLFQRHGNTIAGLASQMRGQKLTLEETAEINAYTKIYREQNFSKHSQINDHISGHDLWSVFPTIRSLNNHGKFKQVPGIQPKYFEIVCHLLGISGGDGFPLDAFQRY